MFVFTFLYLANFMSVVCGPSRRSSKPLKDMFRLPKFHTYPKLELIKNNNSRLFTPETAGVLALQKCASSHLLSANREVFYMPRKANAQSCER